MKLTDFSELLSATKKFNSITIHDIESKIFRVNGINTDFSDIFSIEDELITVLKNGSIKKTMVYINEIEQWSFSKFGHSSYHIFNCHSMNGVKDDDKIYKYKKILRSDGKFLIAVKIYSGKETYLYKLGICQYCLDEYNARFNKNYNQSTFSITEYIKQPIYKGKLTYLFSKNDLEKVPIFYKKTWEQISKKLKGLQEYTCQECGINLTTAKKYLTTHHIHSNSLKNGTISKLKILCIECHSNQNNHAKIKNDPLYGKFIQYKETN